MARTYRSTPEPVYAQKSTELVKKDGSTISVDNLQEKLTFDTTPTKNSTNPVTSGGIKTYVDGLMSGALKRQIVQTLPVSDIDTNTIYMVLDESSSQQGNVYNEYMYISNEWELIGTTQTSGSGVEYVTVARNNPEIDYSDYQKLLAGAYIRIDNQQEAEWISSEIICLPNHNADKYVYTSTVKNGTYYRVVVTVIDHIEFEATCRITEETVGGTTVVANPTLAGTETNLTGLQVGDTKYKVPQGGGGGSYSGPVLMPMNAISIEALGLDEGSYKIDYAKLADKLEELGIDVDSPWLREEESSLQISIGGAYVNSNNGELIHISATKLDGLSGFTITILDNPKSPGSGRPAGYYMPNNQTIREVLNKININQTCGYAVPNYTSISYSYYAISNEVSVTRPVIHDVEYKTIGDVQSFMKELLVPIGSGSGSSE